MSIYRLNQFKDEKLKLASYRSDYSDEYMALYCVTSSC
jgi:hypothetical protein